MGRRGLVLICGAVAALIAVQPALAATIEVTTTADQFGSGDRCSLRESIEAANTNAAFGGCPRGRGEDVVLLRRDKTYGRTITGLEEDANQTGDLDVASPIDIHPRRGRATLDASGIDRLLDVQASGELSLERLTLTGVSVLTPDPRVDGAAINNFGEVTATRTRIVGNVTTSTSSNNGGGVVNAGTMRLERVTIADNEAMNVGGGISHYYGRLTVRDSTIARNETGYVGGGIYIGGSGPGERVRVRDTTISGNISHAGGGFGGGGVNVGDFSGGPGTTMTNVTISGNEADGSGGGIEQFAGAIELNGATITGNVADANADGGSDHGGGIKGSVFLKNSILAGNTDLNPVDPAHDCSGANSEGFNLIQDPGTCFVFDSDIANRNPRLRRLRDNGGPTKTHALKRSSPAINHAGPGSPARDQRGVKRHNPDIGAFER